MAYRFAQTYPQLGMGDCGGNGSMPTCCDSCAHGGSCGRGLGLFNNDGSGLFGSGLFGDSVELFNVSTWSWQEWVAAGVGLYVLSSVFATTQRVGRGVKHAAGAPGRGIRRVKGSLKNTRRKIGRKIGGTP